MRRNYVTTVALGICVTWSIAPVSAQFGVGSTGATTSTAGSLSGMGSNIPSASKITRGLPPSFGSAGRDASYNSGAGANQGGESSNGPVFPSGAASNASGNSVSTVARTVSTPLRWSNLRGADFLRELRNRPTVRSRVAARGVRNNPRRPLAKYKVPPRNWLSYYLPQDRYKFTLNIWRYVTIEDDRGRYPVRYYYHPNSPTFLALLANPPAGLRRSSRVVGFASWQDAMVAGYRPDPVSKPEPAARVLALANLSESPSVMRYIEATYAGQVSPGEFTAGVAYVQQIARAVARRRDTRAQVRPVVAQAVGALLGETSFPTAVTGSRVRVVRRVRIVESAPTSVAPAAVSSSTNVTPGMASISGNANVGSNQVPDSGNRTEDYNRFRSNAASLRR